MAKLNDDDYGVIHFTGQQMAARWWQKFEGGRFYRNRDCLPHEVKIALDGLVYYMFGGMRGIERWLKPEDALRLGFEMGYTFREAMAAGELGPDGDDVEIEDFDPTTLFQPKPPEGSS